MRFPPRAFSLVALLLLGLPGVASGKERIVVAWENRSKDAQAVEQVAGNLDGVLARKGYEVVDDSSVSDFLEALAVPRVDPMPEGLPDKMLLRFRADVLLTVTIDYLLAGKPRTRGPPAGTAVGLSAKLVGNEGQVLWRGTLGTSGAARTALAEGCERLLFTLRRARRTAEPEAAAGAQAAPKRGPRFPLGGVKEGKGAKATKDKEKAAQ